MSRPLVIAILVALSSPARAEPTRVALIDGSRLRTGIATWAAARARLDAEKPKFGLAESVDGKQLDPMEWISDPKLRSMVASDPALRQRMLDLQRSAATDHAWTAHEHEVLDPIEAAVHRALDAYAQAHGIAMVLDRAKLADAVVFAAPGSDITDAFIKDYNAVKKK